jgi:glutamine amidotransferase
MSAPAAGDPVQIGIVDYGMGNRRSVEKALDHAGARPVLSSDADVLAATAGLILPGVGAFPRAMENLARLGLDEMLRERIAAGMPTLGICLGMQLAFDSSEELGGAAGLGIVPGRVRALEAADLKLPHIGWSEVSFIAPQDPLLAGLPERCAFYHVHSFVAVPGEQADTIGTAEYGERFATVVRRGSFHGVQFHPEKSSAAGLRMLGSFARICAEAAHPSGTTER